MRCPTAKPGRNIAWFGNPTKVEVRTLTLTGIKAQPDEFAGLYVMILDGPGKGPVLRDHSQYGYALHRGQAMGCAAGRDQHDRVWSVMQHMIVYKSEGYDTSAFAQLWAVSTTISSMATASSAARASGGRAAGSSSSVITMSGTPTPITPAWPGRRPHSREDAAVRLRRPDQWSSARHEVRVIPIWSAEGHGG